MTPTIIPNVRTSTPYPARAMMLETLSFASEHHRGCYLEKTEAGTP